MDYTKRFLSFLIDEIIFSVMSIVLMLILSHIGILKENFNFSVNESTTYSELTRCLSCGL